MTTIEKITKALDRGGQLLGHFLTWRISDARIPVSSFKAIWTGAGLDEALLPEAATPERVLREAGQRAMRAHKQTHLYTLAAKTNDHTIYAILEKQPDGAGKVPTAQVAQIAVDALGGFSSDQPTNPMVVAVRAEFDEEWGSYVAQDVRRSVIRLIEASASVALRDGGGVYFIPAPFASTVEALRTVLSKVGGSSVTAFPITADASGEAAKEIGAVAVAGLEDEIVKLKEEIDGFARATLAPNGDAPRESTVERRLEAFNALRQRANLYRDVLAIEVTDLDAQIASLEETATLILDVMNDPAGEQVAIPV